MNSLQFERSETIAARVRVAGLYVLVLLMPFVTGCGYIPWPERYGEVTGSPSVRGLNGLGVHRRMWELAGAKVLTPQKLSSRLSKIDAIVLVGSSYQPPGQLARDWLEKWLRDKTGRTVVYFGRDFDAVQLYREETLQDVDEASYARAQIQSASREASNCVNRYTHFPEDTFCRWFFLRTSARPNTYSSFTGPWANELKGLEGTWPVSVLLEPPVSDLQTKKPSWVTGTKSPLTGTRSFFMGADGDETLGEKEIQRSIWKADELDDKAAWDSEWEKAGTARVLLAGSDNAPLVHRITHPDFPNSQILIVANGAPFLNGSIVKPLHRKVSELVIRECLPAKRVAMILYDESGLLINNIESGSETDFGMQLLTVWPLSAITMHAAFLGIIAFAVLLPILGRPQKLQPRSVTDFGLHVEAMGRMLFESRDILYGLKSISDYFTKVRRESPPDWVLQLEAYESAMIVAKEQEKQEKANRKKKKGKGAEAADSSAAPTVSQVKPQVETEVATLPNSATPESVGGAAEQAKPTNTPPTDAVS